MKMKISSSSKSKLRANTLFSLVYQFTLIICGLVLPRIILKTYGSEVNGLVNSITQFLTLITFLELGMGAVVKTALYKPLNSKDINGVSLIIKSANRFFRFIAAVLLGYVLVLTFTYSYISHSTFSPLYSGTLILSMSISYFAQYYFGIVDGLLLTADQRGYVQYILQTLTLIINTIVSYLFIYFGFSIQIVKLVSSFIFLVRPFVLHFYVTKHYKIDTRVRIKEEPIDQKWNGIAQHICAIVMENTDIIVLTIFSSLANVSIYSVYFLVIKGLTQIIVASTNGIEPLLGYHFANNDLEAAYNLYKKTEWAVYNENVLLFGVASVLILPFVLIYTSGITDADYYQPVFALILIIAYIMRCLRTPYNMCILAAGHYRQTQISYIIAAVLNISISIAAVCFFGLIGVAIGTLISMLFQTMWEAIYVSAKIFGKGLLSTFKIIAFSTLVFPIGYFSTIYIPILSLNYFSWILLGLGVFGIWATIIAILNLLFYRKQSFVFFTRIFKQK